VIPAGGAYAVTTEGTWDLDLRRRRFGWATAAQDPRSGRLVASYAPRWAPGGGRVKTETERYRLRSGLGMKRWTLSARAGPKLATFHSNPAADQQERHGRISLRINGAASDVPCPALLLLFSAWTITLEDTTRHGGGQAGGPAFV
jgi:hypothetical protein